MTNLALPRYSVKNHLALAIKADGQKEQVLKIEPGPFDSIVFNPDSGNGKKFLFAITQQPHERSVWNYAGGAPIAKI